MKTPLMAALALSLAGNAALAVYALKEKPAPASAPAAETSDGVATVANAAARTAESSASDNPATAGAHVAWPKIKSARDLHTLVAQLRAAGFPPAVIQRIVHQVAGDAMEMKNPQANLPFWKRSMQTKETMEAMQAYQAQREALVESVLGPEGKASAAMDADTRMQRYGTVSAEKIDAITQIEKDYNELRQKSFANRTPGSGLNMMQQQEMLEKEKREDLAALLSPHELEQYEMRNSQAAHRIMGAVRNVDVSEDEFTALYRMQKSLDDAHPQAAIGNPESMAARFAAQKSMNDQARGMLGEERYFQYLEGADPMYGMVKNFTAQHASIPNATAHQLYELQYEVQSSMMSGRVDPTQRARMMESFNQKLDSILGAELASEYRKQGPGRMFIFNTPGGGIRAVRTDGN